MNRKIFSLLLAAAMVLPLAACGNSEGSSDSWSKENSRKPEITEEALITAAKNTYFDGYEDKTIGEYVESGTAISENNWNVVAYDDLSEEVQDELKEVNYSKENESLVCVDVTRYAYLSLFSDGTSTEHIAIYIAVNMENLNGRCLKILISDWMEKSATEFINKRNACKLSQEELREAAEGIYLPGYEDHTLGEYAAQATELAGSYQTGPIAYTDKGVTVIKALANKNFDLDTDVVMEMQVVKKDLQGNEIGDYRFYISVNRDTGDAWLGYIRLSNGTKTESFSSEREIQQVADVFVEAANWAN